ncbi:Zinc finger protein 496 [Frankliniella fusca]|uniref:Zinc finger protein 496 n=1 Tax=Frankliniella fusca TaxID=407009 RepID=A0AAE1GSP2_9NEOP|nr:Zinc finger protein 496 [Frankliniella fusca]KAK3909716.1 Zinc finger protein 496 [Frankliniella fusca]KAK3912184.1 Zinc finger protein 496 [Frankliniella fusca]KAK3912215.1 Zinc finger protein 496 [Frankliniella fusca]KAK3916621.1 Zinc finger protein 496 [Frankliniella fusca]
MSDEDIFFEACDVRLNPTPPSDVSTPVDLSGVTGFPVNISASVQAPSGAQGHICPKCAKVLKTKSGFKRHLVLHKLNDINARKPQEDQLRSVSVTLFQDVVKEIGEEPSIGESGALKKTFVSKLSSSSDMSLDLISSICSPLLDIILTRDKVMPSVHLEEALSKLNNLLCNSEFCDAIKSKLSPLIIPCDEDSVTVNIVCNRDHQVAYKDFLMSDNDVIAFKKHLGALLRSVYKLGSKSSNNVWQLRCKAIRERFVDSSRNLTDDMFLDVKLWQSGEIVLNEEALNMFVGVEKITQVLLDKDSSVLADSIFNSLTDPENLVVLDKMRLLSRGILAEDLALDFLHDLVNSHTAVSCRLDAQRKMQKVSERNVSLRTDLKRNPNPKPNPN